MNWYIQASFLSIRSLSSCWTTTRNVFRNICIKGLSTFLNRASSWRLHLIVPHVAFNLTIVPIINYLFKAFVPFEMYKGIHIIDFLLTLFDSHSSISLVFVEEFDISANLDLYYDILTEFDQLSERDTGYVLSTDAYLILLSICTQHDYISKHKGDLVEKFDELQNSQIPEKVCKELVAIITHEKIKVWLTLIADLRAVKNLNTSRFCWQYSIRWQERMYLQMRNTQ